MAEIQVNLVAVERELWSGKAQMVVARTVDGDIGVMAGHAPLLAQLREGYAARIIETDGNVLGVAVHGGFLSVTKEGVSILAEDAQLSDEIDVTRRGRPTKRPSPVAATRPIPRPSCAGPGPAARDRQRHLISDADRVGPGMDDRVAGAGWSAWRSSLVLSRDHRDRRAAVDAGPVRGASTSVGAAPAAPMVEGWVLGQGRFRDNEFLLYRSFSPLPGAARTLRPRGSLARRTARRGSAPNPTCCRSMR